MTALDLHIGTIYLTKHNSKWYKLRLDSVIKVKRGAHIRTHYSCTNIDTGREIIIRATVKFKQPAA